MGSQPLQFHCPYDVAVDHNGKVFVTEDSNHRVQVINADLTYSHCFGSEGAKPGEFNFPRSITIDADGMVYVADKFNNRVQKFTPEGKLLAVIDSKGEGGGRLNRPYGLCVDDNDILYVTELYSNRVSMFTSKGRFLGYIGESDGSSFKRPRYIISDQTGRLYISDNMEWSPTNDWNIHCVTSLKRSSKFKICTFVNDIFIVLINSARSNCSIFLYQFSQTHA